MPTAGNPLLDLHRASGGAASTRGTAIERFGFAVPTDEALEVIAAASPDGVLELGAGTGYWSHLLSERGVDVLAYDVDPPPSATNEWFAGTQPWFPVAVGGIETVDTEAARTLLIVWPTRDETWPADALERFHAAGGSRLVFVGEGPGGRSGDDRFHAMLGSIDHCYACEYGIANAICTCSTPVLWRRTTTVDIPVWEGFSDRVEVYEAVGRGGDSGGRHDPAKVGWSPPDDLSPAASRRGPGTAQLSTEPASVIARGARGRGTGATGHRSRGRCG